MATDTTPAEVTDDQRQQALKESYTAATKRLREEYPIRFNALRVEEAAARGVVWTPKPTAAQKAAEQVRSLIEQYGLSDQFTIVEDEEDEVADEEVAEDRD